MRFRHSITMMATFLAVSLGLFWGAEAATINAGHATMSWTGEGVIDKLSNGDRIFGGKITGAILVKHLSVGSAPPQVHKGKMDCQAIPHISETNEVPEPVVCLLSAHYDTDIASVE